jgi:Inositol-pentakisphosphate 2-kinase
MARAVERGHSFSHTDTTQHDADKSERMCIDQASCPWMRSWRASPADADVDDAAKWTDWISAHEELHASSWAEVLQVFRAYMLAVSAKDCSIMIAIAPSEMRAGSVNKASSLASCEACAQHLLNVQARLQGQDPCTALQDAKALHSHTCLGCVAHNDRCYVYRLGVVDFDCKPLAKIGEHKRKDDEILQCWTEHQSSSHASSDAEAVAQPS